MGEDKPSPLAASRVRLQCLGESTEATRQREEFAETQPSLRVLAVDSKHRIQWRD